MSTKTIQLEPWLDILNDVLPPDQNGVLVRLCAAGDDGVELGVLALDGLHPAELLEGFTAPDEWVALGVITRGWAAPTGEGRPSQHPARRRVTTTVLLDRTGGLVGRTIDERGSVVVDGAPGEGAVLDLLRAAMGVAP